MISTLMNIKNLLIILLFGCINVHAAFNVTINATDPSIQYFPPTSWTVVRQGAIDAIGGYMHTSDPSAYAVVTHICTLRPPTYI